MHSQLFTCRFFINAGNNQFYANIIILISNYRFNQTFDKQISIFESLRDSACNRTSFNSLSMRHGKAI